MGYWKYLFKNSFWLFLFSVLTLILAWLVVYRDEAIVWIVIVAFVNCVNLIGNYFAHKKSFPNG
jgi:hypothetical protein